VSYNSHPAVRWLWDCKNLLWCATPCSNKGNCNSLCVLCIVKTCLLLTFLNYTTDHVELQHPQCGKEQVWWWDHCGGQVPRALSALCGSHPYLSSRNWDEVRTKIHSSINTWKCYKDSKRPDSARSNLYHCLLFYSIRQWCTQVQLLSFGVPNTDRKWLDKSAD